MIYIVTLISPIVDAGQISPSPESYQPDSSEAEALQMLAALSTPRLQRLCEIALAAVAAETADGHRPTYSERSGKLDWIAGIPPALIYLTGPAKMVKSWFLQMQIGIRE